ncbi:hypothetical protein J6590_107041, partial [Homalodisca vitripennis]
QPEICCVAKLSTCRTVTPPEQTHPPDSHNRRIVTPARQSPDRHTRRTVTPAGQSHPPDNHRTVTPARQSPDSHTHQTVTRQTHPLDLDSVTFSILNLGARKYKFKRVGTSSVQR